VAVARVELVDVLETAVASVEARFTIAAEGGVIGIELWPVPDADPCDVRLTPRPDGPPCMPAVIEVRHGDAPFGTFHVEDLRFEPAAPPAAGGTS
jgi:hypothetical protein